MTKEPKPILMLNRRKQLIMVKGEDHGIYHFNFGNPTRYAKIKEGYTVADWIKAKLAKGWLEVDESLPRQRQLEHWSFDGVCESTDGCMIEPDGVCTHGHPSWLLAMGMI